MTKKKKGVVVHIRLELDRGFVEKHSVDECEKAFRKQFLDAVPEIVRQGLTQITEIKFPDLKSMLRDK